ncbi:cohesin subunit SA-2-like isoform X1 [Hemicordylus capensis]|uniref:cohesin subunit SA-2-like isoform X1 n=1 Tax=Hemicordylus capensis TaxID=884348 RepID=UPI002302058C|nr:cohesin subunit SA-2-like isoform X1 [Hemicordylus capensis]
MEEFSAADSLPRPSNTAFASGGGGELALLASAATHIFGSSMNKGEGLCAEEEEIQHICSTLQRITAFHNAHDLTQWNLYVKMSELLVFEMEHSPLPVQILLPALQCAYFALLWQLAAVAKNTPSKANLFILRTDLRRYCHICTCYLRHNNRDLCEKAFMILCDLLMIVSHQDSSNNGTTRLLEYLPNTSLQSHMLSFIQDHVFTEEEEEIKGDGILISDDGESSNEEETCVHFFLNFLLFF